MAEFNINILGCGSALPTTRHLATSQIVDFYRLLGGAVLPSIIIAIVLAGLSGFLVDFIALRPLRARNAPRMAGLISTLGMLGRTGELVVHGPKEVETYLRPVMDLFCRGMEFEVRFNPVDTRSHSLVMEDRSLSVYSIPLKHRIPTCGYLFAEKPKEAHIIREMTDFYQVPVRCMKDIKQGQDYVTPEGEVIPNSRLTRPAAPPKRYAFCSDTAYNRSIIPIIEGADLLYHEATFAECDLARAKETFHSTARQAAEIARDAHVKRLVIGHYSARYEDLSELHREAEAVFPGTILGNEGTVIPV